MSKVKKSAYDTVGAHYENKDPVPVNNLLPATSGDVSYPSEWFKNHPGKKPPVFVLHCDKRDFTSLYYTVNKAFDECTLTVETAIAFIWAAFDREPSTLEEDWSSFGLKIGAKGDKITLRDLVDIEVQNGDLRFTATQDPDPTSEDIRRLLLAITTVYRYSNTVDQAEYRTKLRNRAELLMGSKPYNNFGSSLSKFMNFLASRAFVSTMAVVDMYLNKFPHHPYARIRFGTVVARFKDCAVLASVRLMTEMLGLSVTQLCVWIWTTAGRDDFMRINRKGEEIEEKYSYSMYFMELGLSDRSPYSAAINPNLHFLFHAIGSGLGKTRSIHAKNVGDAQTPQLMLNATVAIYANSESTDFTYSFRPIGMDQRTRPTLTQVVSTALKNKPDGTDPLSWVAFMRANKNQVPIEMRLAAAHKWAALDNTRDETIGSFLKKNGQAYLENNSTILRQHSSSLP